MASLIYNHGSYYAVFSYDKNKKWVKIGKLDKKQARLILKQLEIEWAKHKLGLIEIKDISLFDFKESVSAVESLCKLITKNKKTTLGQALDVIEREGSVELHPLLKEAYKKLYGYTSDADGIRHAMMDKPNLSSEDAKYMLLSCSAFINYLIEKATKAGVSIK